MGTKRYLQKQLEYISNCETHILTKRNNKWYMQYKGCKNYGDCNENNLIRQNATSSYTSKFIS